jgi:predicted DNA-binding ribbon-helix-helix protein
MGGPNGPADTIRKRSVMINGHKTSVSLEDQFWDSINEIAAERGQRLTELINVIAEGRDRANLSSALRIFALNHYKQI